MIGVYKCRNDVDLLLIRGLERVILNALIVNDKSRNLSQFSDLMAPHYDLLNRQQNVVKLVKVDLGGCIDFINISNILMKIDASTSGGLVYNLIKQFLNLPIYDIKENKFLLLEGIPPMGEITDVILHHFYQRVFDTTLERMFPGITYTRWGHEVYIVIKQSDSFTFNIKDLEILLYSIRLSEGAIISHMKRGDHGCLPTCNEEKAAFLYEDGDVEVWNYEDI